MRDYLKMNNISSKQLEHLERLSDWISPIQFLKSGNITWSYQIPINGYRCRRHYFDYYREVMYTEDKRHLYLSDMGYAVGLVSHIRQTIDGQGRLVAFVVDMVMHEQLQ